MTVLSKNHAASPNSAQVAGKRARDVEGANQPSESRRRPGDAVGFATLHAAQVRAVGAAFLRARPLVVFPVALTNAILVFASGAPRLQRMLLSSCLGAALLLFFAERWWLRRAAVSERWLAASLMLTSVFLAVACSLSGGLSSPALPLTLAPIAVATAAFGRSRMTILSGAVSASAAGALALLPPGVPFPVIPDPFSRAMTLTSLLGLLALSYAGVAGLVGAYVSTGQLLDRMRITTIEETASRMRATEQVGAKVAHELKNPLAAIKALLQLSRSADDKVGRRITVALAEVERMEVIVRDYIAFTRPLGELRLGEVDLLELIADVAAVLEARAEGRGVQLERLGVPVLVRADHRRLREALYNLVDNAIAASPAGSAVVVQLESSEAFAWIKVRDRGPGIPAALVDAPPFTTTKPEGTGLGLTIARAAVLQHGGDLRFSPNPKGGTVAIIELPKAPASTLEAS